MTKLITFSNKGTKLKEIEPAFAKTQINKQAIAQAVRVYANHLHPSLSKVKTRGDVNISTRKIYRQKGTGNARHGAKSAPIFVGGGDAHGPKGLKRLVTLSKKIKKTALFSSLALKAKEKSLFVVEGLSNIKKTSEAAKLLTNIKKEAGVKESVKSTFIIEVGGSNLFFRNLENSFTYPVNSLNALMIVNGGVVIIDQKAVEQLEKDTPKPRVKSKEKEKVVAAVKPKAKTEKPKAVKAKTAVKKAEKKPAKKVAKGGKI